MATTTETLSVDGVVLNQLAYNISTLAGRLRSPARRTENVPLPGRHGQARTPSKRFDQNVLTLPMWVVGANQDGTIPPALRPVFYANMDMLTRLFSKDGLLDVRHTLPDGSVRQCFAEVLDVLDFDTSQSPGYVPTAQFSVSLTLPYPFWQDLNPLTASIQPGSGVTSAPWTLTGFGAMTAPVEDAVLTITGPCNNPMVASSISSIQYLGNLAAGQSLQLDSSNWSYAGAGGFTPNGANIVHYGDARFLVVPPNGGADPVLTVSNTGAATAATKYSLVGRRKYLVG